MDIIEKYVIHHNAEGKADWVGEVLEDRGELVLMEICDAFMLSWCGLWQLSGELKEELKCECRFFNDMRACYLAAMRTNGVNLRELH